MIIHQTAHKNPHWWETEHDSAWERARSAFKRDWDQTKHDWGIINESDLHQTVGDTVKQAAGKEAIPPHHKPAFEEVEAAYRYGHGARSYYGHDYPEWDDELEAVLKQEWGVLEPSRRARWEADREIIQRAWEFEDSDGI